MDLELVRTRQGVSDITDQTTTRYAEEISHKSKSVDITSLRKDFITALSENRVSGERLDLNELWPVTFAETLKEILETYESNLVRTGRELWKKFYLYSCKAYSNLYSTYAGKKIQIPTLSRFIEVSSTAVKHAIQHTHHRVVISRVLETNVNWAIGPLIDYLDMAKEQSLDIDCMFFLSPNDDPEYGLTRIGHKEATFINNHPEKKANLRLDRGISWIPDITILRHMRLHARTMASLYYLSRTFPGYVHVFFRRQIPDARCNIILDGQEVVRAFQVQLESYDIGMDSTFYEILDPVNAENLCERTVNRQKRVEKDEDKLLSEIMKSARIESHIVEKNGWQDIEDRIVLQNKDKLSFNPWVEDKAKRRLTSYTIDELIRNINQVDVREGETAKTKRILRLLSNEQKVIDEEFMPHLRFFEECKSSL